MQLIRKTAVAVALTVALSGCSQLGLEPGATEEARWMVDPTVRLGPDATQIPLLVQEVGCASGRSAEGRVDSEVSYEDDRILVTVLTRPPEGGQDCPSNPLTPYTLALDEPLDGRELVNGATDELALQPVDGALPGEEPGDGPDDPDSSGPTDGLIPVGDVGEREYFVAGSLVERARHRGDLENVSDLSPHPDGVKIYLGDRLMKEPTPDLLTADGTWLLDVDEDGFEGFSGPFHVLDTLAEAAELQVATGPQPHCAGPPRPAPTGMDEAARVAITPTQATSCIEWFVVNLYLDDQERLVAVQLDLFGP